MNVIYLVLGIVLLISVTGDLLWTTLWIAEGAGPITSLVMEGTWRLLRRIGKRNSRLLSLSGPLILALGLIVWIILLWSAWTLIFASSESALIDTLNRGPISWYDRIYFTGYTIFTLGIGDFAPRKGVWQMLTVIMTASGLLFVTLAITYMLSVLDAVTQKRSFASNVRGLGTTSEEIIQTSWDGEKFRGLELPLNTLTTQLNTLTTNHKAYPVLHYFHSQQDNKAPVISIIIFDEMLTILQFGVPEQDQPDKIIVKSARTGVQNYLETLQHTFVEPAAHTPSTRNLDILREKGIPTVSDNEFASSFDKLSKRRRVLLGLANSDARQWPSQDEK
ncbi:potassium channel family protein (plasmid) [Natrinema zhouii]|uniref:potassium channel family protein n=1 Tax=Natrinema zhouii TaxID=1710539 RepID=UPI001D000266|nr:potassium channel family protein [Natrinema zhouii]UHQ99274.1 potassium channel family protein [Natrinema zhouii]